MSLEVPGFGAMSRLFSFETWQEFASRHGGVVRVRDFLGALPREYQDALKRTPLGRQSDLIIPRPCYVEEKVESIRKKQLNPNAPPFVPSESK